MSGERVTSLEVAKKAGVSQSAVSRVFTPGASVSPKMRKRVLSAAEHLGYQPNNIARAMITGKSRIIGLVVAYLDNQFYPEAIERISILLQEKGYHALVFMGAPTVGDVEDVLQDLLAYQVEGIILASVHMSSSLSRRCNESGIPVMLFNRDQDDVHMSSVTTDNFTGGRAIAAHFAECGYKNVAYMAGFEQASTQHDRERGFMEGLREHGINLVARGEGEFIYEKARSETNRIFGGAERPEAIFVANDHMAFAVMDALRSDLGLRIPEDVAVAGFDDVPIAAWASFNLTSYRQPINRMVAQTVEALLQRIENPQSGRSKVKLEGELIIRGSTRPIGGNS